MTLSFADARAAVLREVVGHPPVDSVPLSGCLGRVLAKDHFADRDFPPLNRSVRDGFALRAADLPGPLAVTLNIRAGDPVQVLKPGEAAEIMTGAPIPVGADAVVMVEHAVRESHGITHPPVAPGTFIARQGEEVGAGQLLIPAGTRLDPSHVSTLAATGEFDVAVFRKPTVAILATGDELVPAGTTPLAHQIRDSNAYALAAQVLRAGGTPQRFGIAPDDSAKTRDMIEEALSCDLVLLSGGVSAGKFDFVEDAFAALGATFTFDRVQIQPGAPVVFGSCRNRPFFGLPGNPVSTLVTFEIFARAALDLLGGCHSSPLPVSYGRLTEPFQHKPGLTRFLPASLSSEGGLTPVAWHGSSDMAAAARANVFLIADAARDRWQAGEFLPLLWK